MLKKEASTSADFNVTERITSGSMAVNRKLKRKLDSGNMENKTASRKGIWKKRRTEIIQSTASINANSETEKAELTKVVGIDCEYVGVGPEGRDDMLARVSVVTSDGKCVYDKYVKPTRSIIDYRTWISGIRPADLRNGEPFENVQKEVVKLLAGRIVVGHALQNDFKVLKITHTRKLTRDTSKYLPLKTLVGKACPSLKVLAKAALGIDIQEGEHSSVVDAQVAMKIYMLYKKKWESDIQKMR